MDFLDAALEDVTDQSEKDATERVPLLLKYAIALMGVQAQNVAQTVVEEQDARIEQRCLDVAFSGPENVARAAWRSLQKVKRIIRLPADRDTKELAADVHEAQTCFALNGALECP